MAENETPVLDDEAWERGERYWREVVDEILTEIGQSGEWPSWEPKFYGDGVTPMERDGLSISDGRSWRDDRSFSIQQFPVTGGSPGISAEVKDYRASLLDFPDINTLEDAERWFEEVPAKGRVPRSRLIIRLEYSEDTGALARSLLRKWLRPGTTVAEMKAFVDATPGVDHW